MKHIIFLFLTCWAVLSVQSQDIIYLNSGYKIKGQIVDTLDNGDIVILVRGKREVQVRPNIISSISQYTSHDYALYSEYPKYKFISEMGGYYYINSNRGYRYNMIHGAQFSPYIFGGINIGFRYETGDMENFYAISMTSDFRFRFTKRNISPYLGIGAGGIHNSYRTPFSRFQDRVTEYKVLLNVSFGTFAKINDKIDFTTAFGYETDFGRKYIYYNLGAAFKL